MSAPKKRRCQRRFLGGCGRCRRVAGRDGHECERHAQAYADKHRHAESLCDLATELACVAGPLKVGRPLTVDEVEVMRAIESVNDAYQSALVADSCIEGLDVYKERGEP